MHQIVLHDARYGPESFAGSWFFAVIVHRIINLPSDEGSPRFQVPSPQSFAG
jgi:hypothetical protein